MYTQYINLLLYPVKDNLYSAYLARPLTVLFISFLLVAVNVPLAWRGYNSMQVRGIHTDLTEEYVVELSNQQREENGIKPLTINPLLSQAALTKATHMVETGNFDHYYKDGQNSITPWQFFEVVGYEYEHAGENLGKDFLESEELVQAWMDSPTHRTNLLSENYTEIGVAVFQGKYLEKEETTLVVQLLAKPLGEGIVTPISESEVNFSSAPVLIAQPSLTKQLVGMYPKLILVLTFIIIGLVGFAIIIDQSRGKKLRSNLQLSKDLWYH